MIQLTGYALDFLRLEQLVCDRADKLTVDFSLVGHQVKYQLPKYHADQIEMFNKQDLLIQCYKNFQLQN